MNTKPLGNAGEDRAAEYLESHGCRILERQYRTPAGEIDIIARDGRTMVFVEVKTRRSTRYGTPAQAVGFRKRQKIIRSAEWYLTRQDLCDIPCRFDVIEVYSMHGDVHIRQFKGAFEA